MDIVFSLIIAMGVVVGLVRTISSGLPDRALILTDQAILVLVGALIGARTGYVVLYWDYFRVHPGEILQVWQGGMSGLSAIYGFLLALLLVAWLHTISPFELADQLMPLGLILTAAGWLAAWWSGSAYGSQIIAWYAVLAQGENGIWGLRFPTQLLGTVLSLGLWSVLEKIQVYKLRIGLRGVIGLLGIGFISFLLSKTRVDPVPVWNSLRLDSWASLGLVSLAVVSLLWIGFSYLLNSARIRLKS